jgi:hypothetical protein
MEVTGSPLTTKKQKRNANTMIREEIKVLTEEEICEIHSTSAWKGYEYEDTTHRFRSSGGVPDGLRTVSPSAL